MRVEVRLYGGLVDRTGARDLSVELPARATVDDLRRRIAADHPTLAPLLDRVNVAVNLEVVRADAPLAEDDEVALLPPVAGGSGSGRRPRTVTGLRAPPLPVDETIAAIATPATGATVVFVGTVRDHSALTERVERLVYSAYEEMAEEVLRTIADELAARWPRLTGVALLHAVGDLPVGAPTVLVACSSPHRDDAYAANRHGLEEVKRRVPIWKREIGADGERWVGLETGGS